MPAPKKKAQVSVYLDPEVMRSLSVYAARREQPSSGGAGLLLFQQMPCPGSQILRRGEHLLDDLL